MLRSVGSFVSLSAMVLLLAACGVTSRHFVVTEQEAGQTVELSVGEKLRVILPGDPSTGFGWQLASEDAVVFRQVDDPVYNADSDALGSGGHFVYNFEAVAVGGAGLRMEYRRSWETGVTAERTFELTVVVK
jgi:inhibitor of cysteine peptidase